MNDKMEGKTSEALPEVTIGLLLSHYDKISSVLSRVVPEFVQELVEFQEQMRFDIIEVYYEENPEIFKILELDTLPRVYFDNELIFNPMFDHELVTQDNIEQNELKDMFKEKFYSCAIQLMNNSIK